MVRPDPSNKTAPTEPSSEINEIVSRHPRKVLVLGEEVKETPPSSNANEIASKLHLQDWLDRFGDAGLFSYTAGVLGAAVFMALALGPGWVGFLAAYLPASILASWAVASHV